MPKLLIAANIPDYPDDVEQFDQVWCVNTAFMRFKPERVNRVFYFDSHKLIAHDFVERVNALPNAEIVTKWPDPEIPNSVAYPLDDLIAFFGLAYWSCSVSYMIALAIYEGWDDITLAGMYHVEDSWEYAHHKPCVEFWVGQALGRGINVTIHGETMLVKPHTWDSEIYGYEVNDLRRLTIDTLAAGYTACSMYPLKILRAKGPPEYMPKYISIREREDAQLPILEETPT